MPNSKWLQQSSRGKNLKLLLHYSWSLETGTQEVLCLQLLHISDNLWDIAQKLCPEGTDISLNPVVIYMRTEVVGVEKLKETTLRQLGITGGRAMLRMISRAPEDLMHQANISAPLPPRPVETVVKKALQVKDTEKEQSELKAKVLNVSSGTSSIADSVAMCSTSINKEFGAEGSDKWRMSVDETSEKNKSVENKKISDEMSVVVSKDSVKLEEMEVDTTDANKAENPVQSDAAPNPACEGPGPEPVEEEVILLGDRNAIAFNAACVQSTVYDDLPEDFYDLTIEDARVLLRDIKRQRAELEDAPITTSAMRELEASKQVLNNLGRYKKSVIRVYFPDQLVLQGIFAPHETVGAVAQFVRSFLSEPGLSFYLFTAPPKQVLSEGVTLVEAGLIPTAVIHFGAEEPAGDDSYLKPDIMNQLTSPTAAMGLASHHRGTSRVAHHRVMESEEKPSTSGRQPTPPKERSVPKQSHRIAAVPPDTHPPKIPRWFKPLK